MDNLPDDWHNFSIRCDTCGEKWHLSEDTACPNTECCVFCGHMEHNTRETNLGPVCGPCAEMKFGE
jgi:hypothetical protein